MKAQLGAYWRGEVPLDRAFWLYTVAGAVIVNLVTSGLFLALLTQNRIILAFVVGYGLSIPYNVFALVGLWRSAHRGRRPPPEGPIYIAIGLVLIIVLSVT